MDNDDIDLRVFHALAQEYPGQPFPTLVLAMSVARKSRAYQSACAGHEAVAVGEIVDFVRASDFGTVMRGQEITEVAPKTDHAVELAGRTPQEQMNYARKNGLT